MTIFVTLDTLDLALFPLVAGDRVFLRGTLGAGKTTFAQKLIQSYLQDPTISITSPTYTYYQKYGTNLYHFDLYRFNQSDDILRIGADEIFDDPSSICIIEWPEKLGNLYNPTKIVDIEILGEGRLFTLQNCQVPKIDNP